MLDRKQLEELDRDIDQVTGRLAIFSRPRDIAVLHVLWLFERYLFDHFEESTKYRRSADYPSNLANPHDWLAFALPWIFDFCSAPEKPKVYKPKGSVEAEALELCQSASTYCDIWTMMTRLFKDWSTAHWASDGTLVVNKVQPPGPDSTMADYFMNAADPPEAMAAATIRSGVDRLKRIVQKYGISRLSAQAPRMDYPNDLIDSIRQVVVAGTAHLWEFPESWDLGGYTLHDFKAVWTSLVSISQIINTLNAADTGRKPAESTPVMGMRRWIRKVSNWSGVDACTVAQILKDITFEGVTKSKNRSRIDISIQPFIPVFEDVLVFSPALAMLANPERNILLLVNAKRPSVHADLRNRKEELQRRSLKEILRQRGIYGVGPLPYTTNGKKRDLDLLLIEPAHKFAVSCELKWLNPADWLNEVIANEEQLADGLIQARKAWKWLIAGGRQSHYEEAIQRDSVLEEGDKRLLLNEHIADYEFRPLLLSHNQIGSGFAFDPDIPILSDRMLHWLLLDPHRLSLKGCWTVGKERRWCVQEGIHYIRSDKVNEYAGLKIRAPGQGITPREAWKPTTGFELEGIQ
ncbi:MAG: hypothetical protein HYU29_00665 [Chloroflexi bacterium]|nr:hypothetical protein [Chloroflexota bacterium]